MDRRAFLRLFAAAGPVAAVAPTYFFAPVGGWKSDVIVHPDEPCLTAEMVRKFQHLMDRAMSNPSGIENSILRDSYVHPKQREAVEAIMVPEELWGLPYCQSKQPYIADEYMGISRSAYPMKRRS